MKIQYLGLWFSLALMLALPVKAETALSVNQAWIRAAPPGAMMLAGYAELKNAGDQPITLSSASSNAFELVELHRTVEVDGVSRMRQVPALTIAPGASEVLAPGGVHLMLMRPRQPIEEGKLIIIDLVTEQGDVIPGAFMVRRASP